MPWTHCGQVVTDDEPCPSCGATKGKWTIRQDVTRTFVLSGADDDGDQAEALDDAADAGSPFCEDCQDEDNAEDEPEERAEPDPVAPDEEAQVETLEAAADSGSPFCEECQGRDNEDAA